MVMVVHLVLVIFQVDEFLQLIMAISSAYYVAMNFVDMEMGGLKLGMIPSCPNCGGYCDEI